MSLQDKSQSSSDVESLKTTVIQSHEVEKPRAYRIGKFEFIRPIGEGGMGEVFLCRDPDKPTLHDQNLVAVKVVSAEMLSESDTLQRFESEAKLLAPIQHENVVRLYDWGRLEGGQHSGSHFIAMEFIQGTSLHGLCRRRRVSFPDIISIAIQTARGLAATHSAHVLHRDLKPANVMITKEGIAKIIDFGIAKPTGGLGVETSDHPDRGFKTKTGIVIGTINYVAPEVARGEPATIASDIYSLGLIIWEMLNGVTPFKSPTIGDTLKRINDESLTWSEAIVDIAPIGFTKFVSRMTSKDPAKRPGSATEVADELTKILASANWEGSFGRPSRFDLDLKWSNEIVDSLHSLGVADSELLFALQAIEDHLSRENDARLTSSEPIEVEPVILVACVNSYKFNRKKAATARQARLATQLVAAQPVGTRTVHKLMSPVRDPSNVPNKKSRLPAGFQKLISGLALIAFVAIGTKLLVYYMREKLRVVTETATETLPPVATTSRVPTKLRLGTRLFYRIQDSANESGSKNELRILDSIQDGKMKWVVNNAYSVELPGGIFSHEAFFDSVLRPQDGQPILKHMNADITVASKNPQVVTTPANVLQVTDRESKVTEDILCEIQDRSLQTVGLQKESVLHIVCDRKTKEPSENGPIVVREMREDYFVVADTGLMFKATITTRKTDPRSPASNETAIAKKTVELDFDLSSDVSNR